DIEVAIGVVIELGYIEVAKVEVMAVAIEIVAIERIEAMTEAMTGIAVVEAVAATMMMKVATTKFA
ncbi:MAG: hypothetical protein HQ462_05105, partial [Deltaproteobacteria bacterium]|nr:hypothetical protein [Deltaproteobacteria bacterium]